MKKIYQSITTFIVLLSMITVELNAQLSGVVTINSGVATGGTNYQSFTALATALNASGVSGPLTVNVVSGTGPYNEQPNFTVISGVSATNSITVNGNGNTLMFNSSNSAQPWTLALTGADRMKFYDLNIIGQGSFAMTCVLSAGADYNSFTSCTFSCPVNGTSSSQIPFAISSLNTSASGGTNSGNFNTVTSCTMSNGYYGAFIYGYTGAPYQTNNSVISCYITDFYQYGLYYPYQKNPTIKWNVIDRITRTSSTTTYGMYGYYCNGALVDGNRVHKLFHGHTSNPSSTCYGMMVAYNGVGGGANPNRVINNIVSDIRSNGTVYGIQAYYLDGDLCHNTVVLDNANTTSGTVYGIYPYGGSGYTVNMKNNIVSVVRGGTGTKYCVYFAGVTGNVTCEKNNYYMNSPAGTNYVGYYSGSATNLAALQAQGIDANSFSTDPLFTNAAIQNYIPTATAINNQGIPVGVVTDIDKLPRDGATPDLGAHEFLSQMCSSTPSANTVMTPTYAICSGDNVDLGLGNYYSDLGITYQWQASTTSSVGPFVAVPNATNIQMTAQNVTMDTWYSVVMTCTNGGGSIQPVGLVYVAGTTTSTVPYYESFEGITGANKMPNCSWSVPSLGSSAYTYISSNTLNRMPRTGTKFASFYYLPAGQNFFYTNGIQLAAGVTYSAALWYTTEYYGYNNWTDLSILVGPNQSTTGLVPIVSSNGPAVSNIYKLLSGTFTIPSSGLYYVAIRATSSSGSAQYLTWDDLSITIPCSLNSPTLTLGTSASTVCSGDPVSLTAVGADSYTWSTGSNNSIINENPINNMLYTVVGTNTLSACSSTQTQMITVNPAPVILIYASSPAVCSGQAVNLTALGGLTYNWSTGGTGALISVSPTSNTTYTVIGSNSFGCNSTATQAISVHPLPTILVSSTQPNDMCAGETHILTASGAGAGTYIWTSSASGLLMQGVSVSINPTSTTAYTVTGTDANGCSNKTTIVQNVVECTGITKSGSSLSGSRVYPNPTAGEFIVELNNSLPKMIEVIDVTGRLISSTTSAHEVINVNISSLAGGIYYVKIQSDNAVEIVKVVKH